jgi:GAF domain-containing protein
MADQNLLLQALRAFAATMRQSYDITEMCYELSDQTVNVLGATGAGVSVLGDAGQLRFVTATDETIVAMELVQETTQTGPCVLAFSSQQPVAVSDIAERDEWPAYSAQAAEMDLNAVVGFPLAHNGTAVGALNVYNHEVREWTEEDLDVIAVFADMATAYLVRTAELSEARELAGQLQEALDTRVIIEQAKGILAGEQNISVDAAFERLRNQSRRTNVRLSEVCRAVVEMGLRIPVEHR